MSSAETSVVEAELSYSKWIMRDVSVGHAESRTTPLIRALRRSGLSFATTSTS